MLLAAAPRRACGGKVMVCNTGNPLKNTCLHARYDEKKTQHNSELQRKPPKGKKKKSSQKTQQLKGAYDVTMTSKLTKLTKLKQ